MPILNYDRYKTVPGADSGIYLRGVPQVKFGIPQKPVENGHEPKAVLWLWNNGPSGTPGRDLTLTKPLANGMTFGFNDWL